MRGSRQLRAAFLIGASVACCHFLLAFELREPYNELVAANPNWLTWQFLTPQALSDHLWNSLIYLQQSPPIPNIILAVGIKLFGWPVGTAWYCLTVSILLAATGAAMMYHMLRQFHFSRYVAAALALLLFLSTDTVVMVYNSFGQTFYEFLSQALVLVVLTSLMQMMRTKSLRATLVLAFATALLALSRSSFALFPLVPLMVLLFARLPQRRRRVATFLVIVITLQLGWAIKNRIVYDFWSPAATSWQGGNFIAGLAKAGGGRQIVETISDRQDNYPPWFVRMIRQHGIVGWHPPVFLDYLPPEITERQQSIDETLNHTNRSENSIGQRLLFDIYTSVYRHLAMRHPRLIFAKFAASYELFWQPTRNYTRQFLALLSVEPRVITWRDDLTIPAAILDGSLPEPRFIMSGGDADRRVAPYRFAALHTAPLLVHWINMVTLHTIAPIFAIAAIWRCLRRRADEQTILFATMWLIYCYGAVVFNMSDHGENMRFRLAIEPVIWILAADSLRRLWHRMRSAKPPPAQSPPSPHAH